MPDFIYALGINQVGKSNAKLLCRHFKYEIDAVLQAEEDDFIKIDGFGEVIAHSLYRYFHDDYTMSLLTEALKIVRLEKDSIETENLPMTGLTFVITGELEKFKNRKELQDKIEALGGKCAGSVSKKTSYLINNDTLSNSSKNKKAKQLEIPILTEEDFMERFL